MQLKTANLFSSLANPIFRRLYAAQTISLLGDALTWLGLAAIAFELAGKSAGIVLAGALTLRVTAFVLLSPVAGVLADKFDRQPILMATHLGRMSLVCLLPFVSEIWQIYALVLGLNIFNALFAPTYQATIPLVTGTADYPQAIALSSATYQLLGVFGPGMAGILALFIGARELFFWDGASFLVAAILIGSIPNGLRVDAPTVAANAGGRLWTDIRTGTDYLWRDAPLRYGLAMQLVAAISGAQILVNTVGYVQGTLHQTLVEYGWVMAGFGLGATGGTLLLGTYPQLRSQVLTLLAGGVLITTALLPANYVGLVPLIILWAIAGCGQSFINLSMQTLIADRTPVGIHGRIYGAHFAWSHLWWAGAYPLAGWLGSSFSGQNFLLGGAIGLAMLALLHSLLSPDRFAHTHAEFWHAHAHQHDPPHQHEHSNMSIDLVAHQHRHQHQDFSHVHTYTDISHEH